MKKISKAGREDIGIWKGRIAASKTMFSRLLREREPYVRALALADGVRGWEQFNSVEDALRDYGYSQQVIPLLYRYAVWLQSATTGAPPVIKYPRGANGDALFATAIEELLGRVNYESGALREWSHAMFDACGTGAAIVWYGFHADVVGMEDVEAASESAAETVQRALMGDTEAKPGQDSGLAAKALDSVLTDPVSRVALPIEQQVLLAQAAGEQDKQALAEAKAADDVRVKRREFWTRRVPMGRTIWDHTVSDLRDARWMARRIVLTLDQAKSMKRIAGGPRQRLKVRATSGDDLYEQVRDVDGKPLGGDENGRVVLWEVWDKQNKAVHLISEEMDEYLEADERYPYPNPQTGEPGVKGFFPCVVATPIMHGMDTPERTAGVPLGSPGYHIQQEIIKLHNFAMASVKRHSSRMYEVPAGLDADVRAQLESGEDGLTIERPAEVEPGKMILPIQFSGEAYKIIDLIGRLTAEWAMVQGISMTDLTGQPQADTATAEQLAVSSGRSQADHILSSMADYMAQGVEILRDFLKIGLYPPEKIAALLGPGNEQVMAAWQASSLDGDRIIYKLASQAKADQVVRVKQLGDALGLVQTYQDPMMPGLPKYDPAPIVEELFMALGVGKLQPIQWTPEAIAQRLMLSGGAPAGGGEGGGGGPDKREREQGPPSRASQQTAARREGR